MELILVEYGVGTGVMPTCQGQTMEFSGRGDVVSLKPAPGRISRLRSDPRGLADLALRAIN